MKYEIKGTPLPVVECYLEVNESIKCESGGMSWMSPNMHMETSGGGLGKMFSKAFSGEKMFQNTYTAKGKEGMIAFTSCFPGEIRAVSLSYGKELICQKSAYLASSPDVELRIFFQKKFGSGLLGGEGFILQKLSGNGIAFLEIDGSVIEKQLAAGESIVVNTGHIAYMDATCTMEIQSVKGVKNVLFGGEGLFNTVITGPGTVGLQTMPVSQVAGAILPYIPVSHDS